MFVYSNNVLRCKLNWDMVFMQTISKTKDVPYFPSDFVIDILTIGVIGGCENSPYFISFLMFYTAFKW